MAKLISAPEGATRLGISDKRLRVLCAERRVKGARLIAGRWFVPESLKMSDIEPRDKGVPLGSRTKRNSNRSQSGRRESLT
jgi:hypothetical protein